MAAQPGSPARHLGGGVGGGAGGLQGGARELLAQVAGALAERLRVGEHAPDVGELGPGAGHQVLADRQQHLPPDPEPGPVHQQVEGGGDAPLDGVLDGEQRRVDRPAQRRLVGLGEAVERDGLAPRRQVAAGHRLVAEGAGRPQVADAHPGSVPQGQRGAVRGCRYVAAGRRVSWATVPTSSPMPNGLKRMASGLSRRRTWEARIAGGHHHQHPGQPLVLPELLQHRGAVHARQQQVEHQHVRGDRPGGRQPRLAAGRHLDQVPLARQDLGHHLAVDLIVLHHQDSDGLGHRRRD